MSAQMPLYAQASTGAARAHEETMPNGSFDLKEFFDSFEVLVDAAGGVAGMRKLILDLAVRGRFTSIELPVLTDGMPFSIPRNWYWGRGTDLFTFVTSGSRGWAQFYSENGPLFLRIGNLDYESINLDLRSVQHVRPPANAEGTRTRVEPGDVLISITGDTGMVGLVPPDLGEAYINQHIALARPGTKLSPAFIARALTAPCLLGRLQSAQRGIKNSLGLEDVRRLAIPVPPLAEQERIVAKVDQLMALCDDLEARQNKKREVGTRLTKSALDALTTADGPEAFDAAWKRVVENFDVLIDRSEKVGELRKAVLSIAMLGRMSTQRASDEPAAALIDRLCAERFASRGSAAKVIPCGEPPFSLPPSWEWARLDQLWRSITDGDHQPPPKSDRGVAFLTIGNLSKGRMDFTSTRYVPHEYFSGLGELRVPSFGDLLYTVVGSYGLPIVVNVDQPFCVQRHVAILKPLSSTNVAFAYRLMQSQFVYRQAERAATGIAQPTVGLGALRNFVVPVPPLAEQQRIVSKIEQLMKTCDALEMWLQRTEGCASKLVEAVVQELVG